MYTLFEALFIIGVVIVGMAVVWLLLRLLRSKRGLKIPLTLALVGFGIAIIPVGYTRFVSQIDLGEREKIVDGELHLTLTGWDRKSYDFLQQKTEVVLLQMANSDVTDETLVLLQNMSKLRELDLDNTSITDEGLKHLANLKALEVLRLGGTRITDSGFTSHLLDIPELKRLDLQNTEISEDLISEWKNAGPGRRALK